MSIKFRFSNESFTNSGVVVTGYSHGIEVRSQYVKSFQSNYEAIPTYTKTVRLLSGSSWNDFKEIANLEFNAQNVMFHGQGGADWFVLTLEELERYYFGLNGDPKLPDYKELCEAMAKGCAKTGNYVPVKQLYEVLKHAQKLDKIGRTVERIFNQWELLVD